MLYSSTILRFRSALDIFPILIGWTRGSEVPARYVHLSGRDVDGALASLYGLGREDGRRACPRCGFLTPEGSLYCPRCSFVLSEAEAVRAEGLREREEEILERVVRRLIERYPDLFEGVLREAVEELKAGKTESYQCGSGGRT